jgi:LysR family transcriptional regulator, positive regulator for ilvC
VGQRDLQLFLHLAKSLHFGRSSEACHVSPSSLTRVIKRLESEVGRPLFERDNRRVTLTKAGVEFRKYADEAVSQWLAIKDNLAQQDLILKGEVSLFCSVTASYSFLYDLLSEFRTEHPGIEIKLHTGDTATAIERILNEEEDIGIAAIPDKYPANLRVQTLTETPLVFICPRAGSHFPDNLKEVEKIDWSAVPMILSEQGLARQRVDVWFRQRKTKPNIYAQVAGNEAIVSMVSLGFGVGLVPRLVVENSPLQEKIRILDVNPPLQSFAIGICILKRRMANPLIKAFWDLAKTSIEGNKGI